MYSWGSGGNGRLGHVPMLHPSINSGSGGRIDAPNPYEGTARELINLPAVSVSIQAKERHANGSTVVDISKTPPSFKLVSLSSPRSPLSKTPKQVFF